MGGLSPQHLSRTPSRGPTALTVSIKAQRPIDKLALSQSAGVGGPGCHSSSAAHWPSTTRWTESCWSEKSHLDGGVWSRPQHRCLTCLVAEEEAPGQGVQPACATFGLGGGQHFVFVPLMQLRTTPQIILANLSQPGKC